MNFFTTVISLTAAALLSGGHPLSPADTLKSVRVSGDGTVTFSIYAPEAETVELGGYVAGENPHSEPARSADGVWSVSVPGLGPGVYRYHFIVDGHKVLDPEDAEDYSRSSLFRLEPSGDEFFAFKPVPHGSMSVRYYQSSVLGMNRRLHVWTPAGYEKSGKKLPVLYLIHGGLEDDSFWPSVGCAGEILDNLLAEGKMKPMIVVMPDGTLTPEQLAGLGASLPSDGFYLTAEIPFFTEDLVSSIIPFIEDSYRVKEGPGNRAVAGLSMGGAETLDLLLKYPEAFRYAAVLSSGWFPDERKRLEEDRTLSSAAPAWNRSLKLLLMTDGGDGDMAAENSKATRRLFDKAGIRYEGASRPGCGHTYVTWRQDLRDFAQRLFK